MKSRRAALHPLTLEGDDEVLVAFRELFMEGTMGLKQLAKNHGLSLLQFMLLHILNRRGPCRAGEVAEEMGVAPPAITVMVTGLEEKNWVRRLPSAGDRRAVGLDLTPKAVRLLAEAGEERLKAFRRVLGRLSPEERAEFAETLRRITEGLRAERVGLDEPATPRRRA